MKVIKKIIPFIFVVSVIQAQDLNWGSYYLPSTYAQEHGIGYLETSGKDIIDGKVVAKTDTLYIIYFDIKGNITQERRRSPYGKKLVILNYTYDTNNNIVKEQSIDPNTKIELQHTYKNVYTDNKLLYQIRDDSLLKIVYDYDQDARVLSKRYFGFDTFRSSRFYPISHRLPNDYFNWSFSLTECEEDYFLYRNGNRSQIIRANCNIDNILNTKYSIDYSYKYNLGKKLIGIYANNYCRVHFIYNAAGLIIKEIRNETLDKKKYKNVIFYNYKKNKQPGTADSP